MVVVLEEELIAMLALMLVVPLPYGWHDAPFDMVASAEHAAHSQHTPWPILPDGSFQLLS